MQQSCQAAYQPSSHTCKNQPKDDDKDKDSDEDKDGDKDKTIFKRHSGQSRQKTNAKSCQAQDHPLTVAKKYHRNVAHTAISAEMKQNSAKKIVPLGTYVTKYSFEWGMT